MILTGSEHPKLSGIPEFSIAEVVTVAELPENTAPSSKFAFAVHMSCLSFRRSTEESTPEVQSEWHHGLRKHNASGSAVPAQWRSSSRALGLKLHRQCASTTVVLLFSQ